LHEMDHEEAADEQEQLEADKVCPPCATRLQSRRKRAGSVVQDADMGSEHGHINPTCCSDECLSTWENALKYLQVRFPARGVLFAVSWQRDSLAGS